MRSDARAGASAVDGGEEGHEALENTRAFLPRAHVDHSRIAQARAGTLSRKRVRTHSGAAATAAGDSPGRRAGRASLGKSPTGSRCWLSSRCGGGGASPLSKRARDDLNAAKSCLKAALAAHGHFLQSLCIPLPARAHAPLARSHARVAPTEGAFASTMFHHERIDYCQLELRLRAWLHGSRAKSAYRWCGGSATKAGGVWTSSCGAPPRFWSRRRPPARQ